VALAWPIRSIGVSGVGLAVRPIDSDGRRVAAAPNVRKDPSWQSESAYA
jgi:hypothetical protein